mmetsp:Transcript_94085/g.287856  ORF Transcript_94085/g.287856 Transcript_94085/m.287856 type:complete len:251 (+) Transcript_94085:467-1219(+)
MLPPHPEVSPMHSGVLDSVREWALVREGEVEPLGEEAAMQRHLAAALGCDVAEPLGQARRQAPRRVHRSAGQIADDAAELLRRRRRRLHPAFDLTHEGLALAQATERHGRGARGAIRRPEHVVHDAHLRVARGSLVERTDGPEVLGGLSKLKVVRDLSVAPLPRGVKNGQRHEACPVLVACHELVFHEAALPMFELPVLLHGAGANGGKLLGREHVASEGARAEALLEAEVAQGVLGGVPRVRDGQLGFR